MTDTLIIRKTARKPTAYMHNAIRDQALVYTLNGPPRGSGQFQLCGLQQTLVTVFTNKTHTSQLQGHCHTSTYTVGMCGS